MSRRKDPKNWLTRECPQCGKQFETPRYRAATYCTSACYEAWAASRRVETTCPECGKAFWYHASWPRKYCSNTCAGKANVGNIASHESSAFTTTCEQCGKMFTTTPKRTRGRFCSLACYGQWMSEHVAGEAHPKFGKPAPRPSDLVALTCPTCSEPFLVKRSHASKRLCCSRRCRHVYMSETGQYSGPNNHNWTGGYESYYGPSWRSAQRAVRLRDRVCQECGISPEKLGRSLDVHHIVPFREFGVERHAEANVLSNLVALCNICHLRVEPRRGRGAA